MIVLKWSHPNTGDITQSFLTLLNEIAPVASNVATPKIALDQKVFWTSVDHADTKGSGFLAQWPWRKGTDLLEVPIPYMFGLYIYQA